MSQQNVEAFMAGVDAINRSDEAGLVGLTTEDVMISPLRSAIAGDYVGHSGVRMFLVDNAETFDTFRASYHDVRDLGDRVLAIGTVHLRARLGQLETDLISAGVAVFRDGKLAAWTDYGDRAEALNASGVEE